MTTLLLAVPLLPGGGEALPPRSPADWVEDLLGLLPCWLAGSTAVAGVGSCGWWPAAGGGVGEGLARVGAWAGGEAAGDGAPGAVLGGGASGVVLGAGAVGGVVVGGGGAAAGVRLGGGEGGVVVGVGVVEGAGFGGGSAAGGEIGRAHV